MSKRNLMLGYGENLVSDLPNPIGHGGEKNHPYVDRDEVYERLCPEMNAAFDYVSNLDEIYCPDTMLFLGSPFIPPILRRAISPATCLQDLVYESLEAVLKSSFQRRR